ncbi:uncharacterized protein BO95DRAFT_519145 [Aspergillus brunneoviolaceus CBS 621.78]|uniref:Uncharacterized protein n=1 Tax=Aspergillus brunneoviolaceus CBS 621.78 TaxID=1450534 RepID=A0ACD1FSK1_9EURO|nr:hypothetical protein BO95DRAFT_519145 [Aspergillus brunneoviolaceus CBS 621.78]RAH39949.1 hypothetical protein BO95DRAFT_519145 [Aspergillus brunneoviolaceus CBS 621.78]
MSSFLHKAEDALHLHHNKHPSQDHDHHHAQAPEQPQQHHHHPQQQPHDPRAPAPPAVAHEGTHHDHSHHGKRESHHPSPAEIARADFMADRQYDRILKSPDHGAGIGFEM